MLCWSSREEIPHVQGKRNPNKMVGTKRGWQPSTLAWRISWIEEPGGLQYLGSQSSRGRSSGLLFPSLSEFSTVYCDPHSQRLWSPPIFYVVPIVLILLNKGSLLIITCVSHPSVLRFHLCNKKFLAVFINIKPEAIQLTSQIKLR